LTDDFVHLTRLLNRPGFTSLFITSDSFHFYRPVSPRLVGALIIMSSLVAVFFLRVRAGALLPTTLDPYYGLLRPLHNWSRNFDNYLPRAVPSALAMLVGVPAFFVERRPLEEAEPVLGLCMFTGGLTDGLLSDRRSSPVIGAGFALYCSLLGAYQISRAR
jgi:hypothetical protein